MEAILVGQKQSTRHQRSAGKTSNRVWKRLSPAAHFRYNHDVPYPWRFWRANMVQDKIQFDPVNYDKRNRFWPEAGCTIKKIIA